MQQNRQRTFRLFLYFLIDITLASCISTSASAGKPLQLLFQRADQSLWLYPLDGGVGRQLTPALAPSDDVVTWSLSPDQQWLAYIQTKGWRKEGADRGQAFLLNLATGEKRVLLEAMLPLHYNWQVAPWDSDRAIIESEPVWSKDSQRFTLISDHTSIVSLYVYNLRTNELRLLTQGQRNIAWPQWSPDEQYILYNEIEAFGTGAGPTGGALWIVPSIGPAPARRLSQGDQDFEQVDHWLDNTHLLTYKRSFPRGRWGDSIVDLATGKHTPFATDLEQTVSCWHYANESNQVSLRFIPPEAAWTTCNAGIAPQGRWAYALVDNPPDQFSRLYLFDRNSHEKTLLAQRLSPDSAAFDMDWSPDGNYLIWLAAAPQSSSQNLPDYDLWALQVEQKQPFILVKQVESLGKHLWFK